MKFWENDKRNLFAIFYIGRTNRSTDQNEENWEIQDRTSTKFIENQGGLEPGPNTSQKLDHFNKKY